MSGQEPATVGEHPFKPHYSVKSAARELRTSERRIRKAMEDGGLRYVMFGGRPIIPGSEVRQMAEKIA